MGKHTLGRHEESRNFVREELLGKGKADSRQTTLPTWHCSLLVPQEALAQWSSLRAYCMGRNGCAPYLILIQSVIRYLNKSMTLARKLRVLSKGYDWMQGVRSCGSVWPNILDCRDGIGTTFVIMRNIRNCEKHSLDLSSLWIFVLGSQSWYHSWWHLINEH